MPTKGGFGEDWLLQSSNCLDTGYISRHLIYCAVPKWKLSILNNVIILVSSTGQYTIEPWKCFSNKPQYAENCSFNKEGKKVIYRISPLFLFEYNLTLLYFYKVFNQFLIHYITKRIRVIEKIVFIYLYYFLWLY